MSETITHPASIRKPPARSAEPYWNPYAVGALLGVMLLASYLVAGRGLGATGAFSSVAAWIASTFSPIHAMVSPVHARYLADGSPLTAWLVFLILGAFAGAAPLSGWLAGRTRFMVEKGPHMSSAKAPRRRGIRRRDRRDRRQGRDGMHQRPGAHGRLDLTWQPAFMVSVFAARLRRRLVLQEGMDMMFPLSSTLVPPRP